MLYLVNIRSSFLLWILNFFNILKVYFALQWCAITLFFVSEVYLSESRWLRCYLLAELSKPMHFFVFSNVNNQQQQHPRNKHFRCIKTGIGFHFIELAGWNVSRAWINLICSSAKEPVESIRRGAAKLVSGPFRFIDASLAG